MSIIYDDYDSDDGDAGDESLVDLIEGDCEPVISDCPIEPDVDDEQEDILDN